MHHVLVHQNRLSVPGGPHSQNDSIILPRPGVRKIGERPRANYAGDSRGAKYFAPSANLLLLDLIPLHEL